MYPEFVAFFTIFYMISTQYISNSTIAKDSVRNDYDNNMLRELLQGQVRLQSLIEKNNKKIEDLQLRMDQLDDNIKNQSVVMETIVEQQMVITAEIFTVSQTLPFCCCQYENTTTPAKPDATTPNPSKSLPTNCAEAMGESGSDGIYKINITNFDKGPFNVYCMRKVAKSLEEEMINGTWLVFQRRQDNSTDFYLDWHTYQRGFGALNGNFWIGLDKLYVLTNSVKQELWIQLEDYDGKKAWAKYGSFAIGDNDESYKLKTLDAYEGTAGDSLIPMHLGQKWSTRDSNERTCAELYKGAWWYQWCAESNLNGMYGENEFGKGVIWKTFRGFEYSLKYVHMAIRPRKHYIRN